MSSERGAAAVSFSKDGDPNLELQGGVLLAGTPTSVLGSCRGLVMQGPY